MGERKLKESHERAVLEELKALRKSAKELKNRMQRAMDELERIRALLRAKLLALERDMANLKDGAAARDAKLSALEDQVKSMQAKFGRNEQDHLRQQKTKQNRDERDGRHCVHLRALGPREDFLNVKTSCKGCLIALAGLALLIHCYQ